MLCDICLKVLHHRRGLVDSYKPGLTDEDVLGEEVRNESEEEEEEETTESEDPYLWFEYLHHSTLDTLADSATKCEICRPLWNNLPKPGLDFVLDSEHANVLTFMKLWFWGPNQFVVDIRMQSKPENDALDGAQVQCLLALDQRRTCTSLAEGATIGDSTSSKEALQTARHWLHSCVHEHEACNRRIESQEDATWFPTRLLYLGGHDNEVRLIITSNKPPGGPYMTLSHRWGSAKFIKLLKSNIDSFCSGVSVADMPRTFQDAIVTSRQLGVQYLWIDSLCIMQDKDDLTDWIKEAGTMSKVYSNSYCNLSASDTDEAAEGLFRSRDENAFNPTTVQFCTAGFDASKSFVELEVMQGRFWMENVNWCPIQNRGWVFQERVLAPRVLHFGHIQLLWECREQNACERYPLGLPEAIRCRKFKEIVDIGRHKGTSVQQSLDIRGDGSIYSMWRWAVREYSETSLTIPTDRLIAISGLAGLFASITGDSYYAGLWRKDLEFDLLWFNERSCPTRKDGPYSRPTVWRAPTWSWASIDYDVMTTSFPDGGLQFFKVRDVVLNYPTEDKMGLITSGWLDLQGTLKPMSLYQAPGTKSEREKWIMLEPRVETDTFWFQEVYLDIPTFDSSAFDDDNAKGNIFYMLGYHCSYFGSIKMAILLILRATDRRKALFERIGLARIHFHEKDSQISLDILGTHDMSEDDQKRLPSLEHHEDGTHTIRIV